MKVDRTSAPGQAVGRIPDRHDWLGYPDGGVADVPFEELVDAIAAVMEQQRPTVVHSFGPDGIFGHPTTSRSRPLPTLPSCGTPPLRGVHFGG